MEYRNKKILLLFILPAFFYKLDESRHDLCGRISSPLIATTLCCSGNIVEEASSCPTQFVSSLVPNVCTICFQSGPNSVRKIYLHTEYSCAADYSHTINHFPAHYYTPFCTYKNDTKIHFIFHIVLSAFYFFFFLLCKRQ